MHDQSVNLTLMEEWELSMEEQTCLPHIPLLPPVTANQLGSQRWSFHSMLCSKNKKKSTGHKQITVSCEQDSMRCKLNLSGLNLWGMIWFKNVVKSNQMLRWLDVCKHICKILLAPSAKWLPRLESSGEEHTLLSFSDEQVWWWWANRNAGLVKSRPYLNTPA